MTCSRRSRPRIIELGRFIQAAIDRPSLNSSTKEYHSRADSSGTHLANRYRDRDCCKEPPSLLECYEEPSLHWPNAHSLQWPHKHPTRMLCASRYERAHCPKRHSSLIPLFLADHPSTEPHPPRNPQRFASPLAPQGHEGQRIQRDPFQVSHNKMRVVRGAG